MSKTIFDPEARLRLLTRLDRLAPETPAQWGKFTAPRMVSHLIASVRIALGDMPATIKPDILSLPVIRYLAIHVLPWPRGVPTAPEMLRREPGTWQEDVATLRSLLDRAAANGSAGRWEAHPAFGALSGADWGVLIHRHVAHHLTQFGV